MNPETIAALEDSLARLALVLEQPALVLWEIVHWQQQLEAIMALVTTLVFFALIVPLSFWIGIQLYHASHDPGVDDGFEVFYAIIMSVLFLVVAGIVLGAVVRPAVGKLLNPGYYALERLVLLLTS